MQISLKEEDRLSYAIHTIDKETCLVPRKALIRKEDKTVVKNRLFEG